MWHKQSGGRRNQVIHEIFGKENIVGIDIGSNCIKIIEVQPNGKGWEVCNAAIAPTPLESVKDGIIVSTADVASAIRIMMRENGIKANGAVCAISGTNVIIRQVSMPKMPEAVLRKSIKYEAKRYITTTTEDTVVEFEILGDSEDPANMNVMLIAAPDTMINSRVITIEAAGLEPLSVDTEAFAIIRTLVDMNSTDEYLNRTIAILDLGASHTDMNIITKGDFALTRNISIAGDSFTNSIKNTLAVSFGEAEKLKYLMTLDANASLNNENSIERKCLTIVQPLLDELIREVRRSITFYQSQFTENSSEMMVSKIILTGGSARIPGIEKYFSEKLGIQSQISNLFNQTAIAPGKLSDEFIADNFCVLNTACGLALKESLPEIKKAA